MHVICVCDINTHGNVLLFLGVFFLVRILDTFWILLLIKKVNQIIKINCLPIEQDE